MNHRKVAPYVGAWIETSSLLISIHSARSHPTWVRGLKPSSYPRFAITYLSHPTWVRGLKPKVWYNRGFGMKSHPTWVRGLKHSSGAAMYCKLPSHPTWVRGLKRTFLGRYDQNKTVAPYVGAWIETSPDAEAFIVAGGRTLRGCVD